MAAPFPTREDFFQVGAREILARASLRPAGKRVTAAAVYTVGTNVNSALAGCAAMADEVMRHTAIRFGELYLDSSEGDALERVVTDRVAPDLTRKKPSPSLVELTIARVVSPESGSPTTLESGRIVRTQTGIEFELLSDVSFGANVLGAAKVDAQALSAGSDGNVAAGTVVSFAEVPQDSGISVTNLEAAVGGSDIESDRDYLIRAKMELASRARGVTGAIEAAILRVPGVKWAIVEEVLEQGDPSGVLRIYVSDANGRSNAALLEQARVAALPVRIAGMVPSFVSVSPQLQSVWYQLDFDVGTNLAAARSQLKSLTVAMVNELSPGESLTRSMLFAIARSVPGAIVMGNSIVSPGGDVSPGVGKKLTTNASLVLVNGV